MCGDRLSNGLSTDTPVFNQPSNEQEFKRQMRRDQNDNDNIGQHETWHDYYRCANRAGTDQFGYECSEERRFWPYWRYSPFFDIASLTPSGKCDQLSNSYRICVMRTDGVYRYEYSMEEECVNNGGEMYTMHHFLHFINRKESRCTERNMVYGFYFDQEMITTGSRPSKRCLRIAPGRCSRTFNTSPGVLSNAEDGEYPRFIWHMPQVDEEVDCVLRIRYNITTIQTENKLRYAPAGDNESFKVFQDRSHIFTIVPRPSTIDSTAVIHNLNVRGKRGNIVQTYPAVEYDFVPNKLDISTLQYVHIQWAGSNSHRNKPPGGDGQTGDDGQGQTGTDRTNFLEIASMNANYPLPFENSELWKSVEWVWSSNSVDPSKGVIEDLALYFATSGYYHCREGCDRSLTSSRAKLNSQLNNAPASLHGHVVRFNATGKYYYICSRYNHIYPSLALPYTHNF